MVSPILIEVFFVVVWVVYFILGILCHRLVVIDALVVRALKLVQVSVNGLRQKVVLASSVVGCNTVLVVRVEGGQRCVLTQYFEAIGVNFDGVLLRQASRGAQTRIVWADDQLVQFHHQLLYLVLSLKRNLPL